MICAGNSIVRRQTSRSKEVRTVSLLRRLTVMAIINALVRKQNFQREIRRPSKQNCGRCRPPGCSRKPSFLLPTPLEVRRHTSPHPIKFLTFLRLKDFPVSRFCLLRFSNIRSVFVISHLFLNASCFSNAHSIITLYPVFPTYAKRC